jgi:hypothetical protein
MRDTYGEARLVSIPTRDNTLDTPYVCLQSTQGLAPAQNRAWAHARPAPELDPSPLIIICCYIIKPRRGEARLLAMDANAPPQNVISIDSVKISSYM